MEDLDNLSQYSCPRYIGKNKSTHLIEFSDASEQAYCAAVYLATGTKSHLYCSKICIAPVEPLTISQLELQAAVLLVNLIERVNRIVKVPHYQIFLYTDSTIVLSWLLCPASNWRTFVINHVSKIINAYLIQHWHHAQSGANQAELATGGLSTSSSIESVL